MALSYGEVRYGSSGDDVKELQRRLNSAGYSVAVDGSFGNQTRKAVQDYQTKNNLTVDGIVGSQTWGSLLGTVAQPQGSTASPQTAGKPAAYESKNQGELDALYDQIVNRKPFQFNLDSNALYQQYKDRYVRLGQEAMADTMGQAAGLTGGYGSSYSQAAGQQAYNQYLQQLGDIVPDIYAQERAAYDQEGADLASRYSMLSDREDRDYSRWADDYSRWLTERQAAQDQANWEKQMAFEEEQAALAQSNWERQFAYTTSRGSGSGGSKAATDADGGIMVDERMVALAEEFMENVDNGYMNISDIGPFLKDNYPKGYSDDLYDTFYGVYVMLREQKKNQGTQNQVTQGNQYSYTPPAHGMPTVKENWIWH